MYECFMYYFVFIFFVLQVLVFEDVFNGVEVVYVVGMQCVWIFYKGINKEIYKYLVTLVLESLEDFRFEMFGLLLYDS